ncbi:MAG: hypothetical protein ACLU0O_01840 [Collinsella sp.]
MAELESQPLSAEERAELEELRAEKARREEPRKRPVASVRTGRPARRASGRRRQPRRLHRACAKPAAASPCPPHRNLSQKPLTPSRRAQTEP